MIEMMLLGVLTVRCVDGVATVEPEVYEAERNEVLEWHSDLEFSLTFDSEGNANLGSHKKDDQHVRKLPAARLRVGKNTYSVQSAQCIGDPVIIVR